MQKQFNKHTPEMWNEFSIQIAESLLLHSNTVFKHPDLVVRPVSLSLFFFSLYTCVFACAHVCTHARGWHRACIFVCPHNVSIINSRKLIQFIAFTYWPESLTGRDYGWLGVYENGKKKGESKKEREKERKWKHVCKENMSGWQDRDCSRVEAKSSRW